jgi:hypothetical protein
MHAIIKLFIGAVLLIGAVMYIYDDMSVLGHSARGDLVTVINGTVPAFVGLIGLFVIWLELDELKIQREAKPSKK